MDSGRHASDHKPSIFRRFLSFLIMVAVVVVGAWLLRSFVVEPFQIPSASMEDTIKTGDMVFAEKVSYHFSDPEQGDIVVFSDPQVPSRTLIKRVIATEGQTVDLRDGKVYVDGVALDEPYTDGLPSYPLNTVGTVDISYPYTIPKGDVWVMGDNRTNSSDSRYFGPIDKDTVFGKAFAIYWPVESLAWIKVAHFEMRPVNYDHKELHDYERHII